MQYSKLQSASASAVEFNFCTIMKNQQKGRRTKIVRLRVEIVFDVQLEITYRAIKISIATLAPRTSVFLTENKQVAF